MLAFFLALGLTLVCNHWTSAFSAETVHLDIETKQGIAWPMFDMQSAEELMVHGIHCVEVVEKCIDDRAPKNETGVPVVSTYDELHKMHCQHCQRLVRLVKRFHEAHPDFSVSPDICSILPLKRVRRLRYAGYSKYSNKRKRRSTTKSPSEEFRSLMTENLGNLLIKEYRGEDLSKAEAEFMRQIESEEAVVGAVRGLVCSNVGTGRSEPLLHVTELIKQSHSICW